MLAQGTATTPAGKHLLDIEVARVLVRYPGELIATLGGHRSVPLISAFIHPATNAHQAYRRAEGPSPLVLSVAVTEDLVDAGHEWLFYVTTSDATSVTVSYTITLVLD